MEDGQVDSQSYIDDPVNVANGKLYRVDRDLRMSGSGLQLSVERFYNSQVTAVSPFGRGWTYNYHQYLTMNWDFSVTAFEGDGGTQLYKFVATNPGAWVDSFDNDPLIDYPLDEGYYVSSPDNPATLRRETNGIYIIREKNGAEYHYQGYYAFWRGGNQSNIAGKLIAIVDPNGNRVRLDYDASGNLATVTDPVGRQLRFTYSNGLVSSVTDPAGRVTRYTYDAQQRLVEVIDPAGHRSTYTYYPDHKLATKTDARGNTITYTYYPDGKAKNVINAEGALYNTFVYNPASHMTTRTDAKGHTTTFYYNDTGNVVREVNPLGQETRTSWDAAYNKTSITNARGQVFAFAYDGKQNLTRVTDPLGGITQLEYDPVFNKVKRLIDPKDQEVRLEYDSRGNLTTLTDALGRVTRFGYDGAGNIISITDP
ncbi:MAG: DUF6531 domain-containing protein, partial [Syntrophothermus sp.]